MTDPTEPGDPCTSEFASEHSGRGGKADGRYLGITSKTEISYVYAHNVVFALSAFTTYVGWANVVAVRDALATAGDGVLLDRLSSFAFDGLSGELFVRVLERAPGQPVAVVLAVEPRWSRVDNFSGSRAEGYGAEFKLLADVVLADHLFAAINLSYELGIQKLDVPNAGWERASAPNASIAFTTDFKPPDNPFVERVFAGVEARIRSAFEGLAADRLFGTAVFIGPTMNIAFGNERNLALAWTPQVAGRSRVTAIPRSLDLVAFERHEFRLKFATPISLPQ
jgi:hypothetical protein